MRIINNHLVFRPPPGLPDIPGLKEVSIEGHKWAALPYYQEYAQILFNLKLNPPEPIRTKYEWAGHYKPYKHQEDTAAFFTMHRRCYCFNGMGSGKTLSALWAADYLMSIGQVNTCLIVSPLSTLDPVWGETIFKHFYKRTFAILHGSKDKRKRLLDCKKNFYVINHDGVETILPELLARKDIDLIILDEAGEYRNANTKRWRTMKKLCSAEKRVWALTGTPTPNAPTDAFGICKMVTPEKYEGSFTKFKATTMMQLSQFKWIARQGAEETVNQILSPAIRFATRDCIELPETIYHEREAELSSQQKTHLKRLELDAATEIGDKTITAVNAAVLIQKVIQASCGVAYASDKSSVEFDYGHRLRVLEDTIEEAEAKVIIFVPFTNMLDNLAEKLRKKWTCEVVDGGVSKTKRDAIFSAFQNSADPKLLLANPETMSHGLNLIAADTIIWYAPIWSGDIYPQANARIVRPGQTRTTNIVHIFATPTERKVYAALKEKGRLQDIVLDLVKSV